MSDRFSLVLFSTDPVFITSAVAAGIDSIIVDWEHEGKELRQAGANTQINRCTLDDLRQVRNATTARVICRLNSFGPTTAREVEDAVDAGADELMLPMVRTVGEVTALLDLVQGRCGVGILIETQAAVDRAKELADLPLSRVYIGLNDLALDRKTPHIFSAIADGTIDRIRDAFTVPFGFGGLTLPDRGYPIPCRLLISEMARLGSSFSFLRRSFHADIRGRSMAFEVPRIHDAIQQAYRRSPDEVARDRKEFRALCHSLDQCAGGAR